MPALLYYHMEVAEAILIRNIDCFCGFNLSFLNFKFFFLPYSVSFLFLSPFILILKSILLVLNFSFLCFPYFVSTHVPSMPQHKTRMWSLGSPALDRYWRLGKIVESPVGVMGGAGRRKQKRVGERLCLIYEVPIIVLSVSSTRHLQGYCR